MKIIFTIILITSVFGTSLAQTCNFKISGHVEDADTKEKLISASVIIKETGRQIITDSKGDFLFTGLCAGEYSIVITHVNCDTIQKIINLIDDFHFDVFLPHFNNTLGEVTVSAKKGIKNTGFKKEFSGRDLQETKGLTLAEALNNINGVTMLQTGSNISKPVIHGLHSNRILTINNGVRQEGQQWGNEHAPEIDPYIADKLTVIKGVDELRFGSDAIGGVILVESRPLSNTPGYSAEFNAGYFTNNKQYVVSGMFEQQLKKYPAFTYRVQGTYKKGANATTPGYRLNNTGNEEKNFSLTAGWIKGNISTELFYSNFSTKVGIFTGSHIGNLTDLQNAIASTKPDDVFLGQNTYKIQRPYQDVNHHLLKSKTFLKAGNQRFTFLVAGQFNHRKEYDIVRSITNKNPQLDLSIYTITEDLVWDQPKKNNFMGTAGVVLVQQKNTYGGRYFIPNYLAYSFGGFYIEKWSSHKWELQTGLRYDNKSINTERLKFNGAIINYDFNFSTLASSFNAAFYPALQWRLNANFSLASRAPYVNELLSDGIHHGTATYEKGDITLKPEKGVNINASINYHNKSNNFSFDLLLYSNNIRDFIYQQPLPETPVLTIAGAFPLLEFRQTDAVLNGLDLEASLKITPKLEWQSKLSFLHARNKLLNDWLILMPANRLNNELTYFFSDWKILSNTYLSGEMLNVLEQKNVPDDSNGKQDYKLPPATYNLINLYASTTILVMKIPLTLGIGVRNLLNVVYRDYLNSMRYFTDDLGRNISIRINIPIK